MYGNMTSADSSALSREDKNRQRLDVIKEIMMNCQRGGA